MRRTQDGEALELVVGLGNPGSGYTYTRHNLGFLIVEAFLLAAFGSGSAKKSAPTWKPRYDGKFLTQSSNTSIPEHWLMPETFMNLSGQSVQACAKAFSVAPERVLIIHDELDLPVGTVRAKFGGGPGGHNGVRSVLEVLGTGDFWRLRIGIGKPGPEFKGDGADYVLGKPPRQELEQLVEGGVTALQTLFDQGLTKGMQQLNTVKPAPQN